MQSTVEARRLYPGGAFLGNQFQPSTGTANQGASSLVTDSQCGFVVLFQDDDEEAPPPPNQSPRPALRRGRIPLGGEFQVLSYSSWWYNEPSAIQLADGSYVVTWTSCGSNGGDNSGTSIQAHRFAADWQPVGVTFQVNSYTSDWQKRPMVANSPEGGSSIACSSPGSYGPDNRGYSVQVQRYAAGGQPRGSETQVNTRRRRTKSCRSSPRTTRETS